MSAWDKFLELMSMPGYIEKTETKFARLEISEEEIFKWIREGKLRVRSDGYVEVVEQPRQIKNITPPKPVT